MISTFLIKKQRTTARSLFSSIAACFYVARQICTAYVIVCAQQSTDRLAIIISQDIACSYQQRERESSQYSVFLPWFEREFASSCVRDCCSLVEQQRESRDSLVYYSNTDQFDIITAACEIYATEVQAAKNVKCNSQHCSMFSPLHYSHRLTISMRKSSLAFFESVYNFSRP